jgi:DNA-binding NarL/FixJ family response regulator
VASQLRPRPEVQVVDAAELDQAEVAVVVAERVDEEVLRVLRAVRRGSVPRTVLIAGSLDDAAVVTAAEAGVSALVRRSEVTPERLVSVILKARDGGAEMPANLLAGLLGQVGRLQRQVLAPRGLRFSGLSDREVEVLRLVADGLDTGEIARELAFSERTIKSVLRRGARRGRAGGCGRARRAPVARTSPRGPACLHPPCTPHLEVGGHGLAPRLL